ncbi:MAG: lipid-A-disaccharide synthase [Candidatus Marinimicrobia bacterium]|jgi:lipid-A-disaccharide synthase|nr:lipid-A-disaccharide synthase [Candidatus Neomarinimicrobiota bacterium]MBT3617359.1 lipid-A-disaccharide synthase [Candidatus Neomarinimicrobiota bacterium]MBT3829299.1 lipid-A-disaccharide synthase [Candidatus Neomarinimicrobiota bacterium]MBT3998257.1 lipid-A-disaccharide synthase [Candidatus Neomarinimicrobiota bacterium]MBT4281558.1 lipid-A-disaccharide synthase [Candidatus Neomarinimicrobiota bacterium]
MNSLTYFLVVGEASGDLHGSNLIREIKRQYPNAEFVGHGGDRMAKEGMKILEHVDNLAIMGFTEVVKHLPYFTKVMSETVDKIKEINPNRIILIDYPGFNLRLAKNVQGLKTPITYFIMPQMWAWKESRVKILKKYIDQSLCIFPFEQDWFEDRGVPAFFVGHPFVDDSMSNINSAKFYSKHSLTKQDPILTLLPGSRQQEIENHLPIFLETYQMLKKELPSLQCILGKAPGVTIYNLPPGVRVESEHPPSAIQFGTAAVAASGTVTLECAVLDTPVVVSYKLSTLSYQFIKRLSKVPFVSIVNLIANRQIVPEFLQSKMTAKNLTKAILPLLSKTQERKTMIINYEEVRRTLGLPGVYQRAADAILSKTNMAR